MFEKLIFFLFIIQIVFFIQSLMHINKFLNAILIKNIYRNIYKIVYLIHCKLRIYNVNNFYPLDFRKEFDLKLFATNKLKSGLAITENFSHL